MNPEPAALTCPVCRGDYITVVKDKGVYCADCNRTYSVSQSHGLGSTVKSGSLGTPKPVASGRM